MTSKRLIKKYPNRRLYDTVVSKYVTLSQVRDLVMSGTEFQVVEAGSDEDITRQVLLQIITDQENGDSPLFSAKLLSQFIRLYQGVVPGVFRDYMEQSLNVFLEQQERYQQQVKSLLGGDDDPLRAFTDLTRRNLETWRQVQEDFLRLSGVGQHEDPGAGGKGGDRD